MWEDVSISSPSPSGPVFFTEIQGGMFSGALCSHTIESLISEPSLTLGRGQVGEYST